MRIFKINNLATMNKELIIFTIRDIHIMVLTQIMMKYLYMTLILIINRMIKNLEKILKILITNY